MHNRDVALLTRTAVALRAQGKHAEATQLDDAVEMLRRGASEPGPSGYEPA